MDGPYFPLLYRPSPYFCSFYSLIAISSWVSPVMPRLVRLKSCCPQCQQGPSSPKNESALFAFVYAKQHLLLLENFSSRRKHCDGLFTAQSLTNYSRLVKMCIVSFWPVFFLSGRRNADNSMHLSPSKRNDWEYQPVNCNIYCITSNRYRCNLQPGTTI